MVSDLSKKFIGKDLGIGCILEGINAEGPVIQDRGGLPDSEKFLGNENPE